MKQLLVLLTLLSLSAFAQQQGGGGGAGGSAVTVPAYANCLGGGPTGSIIPCSLPTTNGPQYVLSTSVFPGSSFGFFTAIDPLSGFADVMWGDETGTYLMLCGDFPCTPGSANIIKVSTDTGNQNQSGVIRFDTSTKLPALEWSDAASTGMIFVRFSDTSGSGTFTIQTITPTGVTSLSGSTMVIGTDNFCQVIFLDTTTPTSPKVRTVHCTNASGSTYSAPNTGLSTVTSAQPYTWVVSSALGPDGFTSYGFVDQGTGNAYYAHNNNTTGSSPCVSTIVGDGSAYGVFANSWVAITNAGLPLIATSNSTGVILAELSSISCGTQTTIQVTSDAATAQTLVLAGNVPLISGTLALPNTPQRIILCDTLACANPKISVIGSYATDNTSSLAVTSDGTHLYDVFASFTGEVDWPILIALTNPSSAYPFNILAPITLYPTLLPSPSPPNVVFGGCGAGSDTRTYYVVGFSANRGSVGPSTSVTNTTCNNASVSDTVTNPTDAGVASYIVYIGTPSLVGEIGNGNLFGYNSAPGGVTHVTSYSADNLPVTSNRSAGAAMTGTFTTQYLWVEPGPTGGDCNSPVTVTEVCFAPGVFGPTAGNDTDLVSGFDAATRHLGPGQALYLVTGGVTDFSTAGGAGVLICAICMGTGSNGNGVQDLNTELLTSNNVSGSSGDVISVKTITQMTGGDLSISLVGVEANLLLEGGTIPSGVPAAAFHGDEISFGIGPTAVSIVSDFLADGAVSGLSSNEGLTIDSNQSVNANGTGISGPGAMGFHVWGEVNSQVDAVMTYKPQTLSALDSLTVPSGTWGTCHHCAPTTVTGGIVTNSTCTSTGSADIPAFFNGSVWKCPSNLP